MLWYTYAIAPWHKYVVNHVSADVYIGLSWITWTTDALSKWSVQASKHRYTHAHVHNDVTLVWGSLRLAPIIGVGRFFDYIKTFMCYNNVPAICGWRGPNIVWKWEPWDAHIYGVHIYCFMTPVNTERRLCYMEVNWFCVFSIGFNYLISGPRGISGSLHCGKTHNYAYVKSWMCT